MILSLVPISAFGGITHVTTAVDVCPGANHILFGHLKKKICLYHLDNEHIKILTMVDLVHAKIVARRPLENYEMLDHHVN